jgi:hypothetical protein
MSLLIPDDPLALKQAAQKTLTFSAQTACGSCGVAAGAETLVSSWMLCGGEECPRSGYSTCQNGNDY